MHARRGRCAQAPPRLPCSPPPASSTTHRVTAPRYAHQRPRSAAACAYGIHLRSAGTLPLPVVPRNYISHLSTKSGASACSRGISAPAMALQPRTAPAATALSSLTASAPVPAPPSSAPRRFLGDLSSLWHVFTSATVFGGISAALTQVRGRGSPLLSHRMSAGPTYPVSLSVRSSATLILTLLGAVGLPPNAQRKRAFAIAQPYTIHLHLTLASETA